jgi:drug/metabolite transporter (DMT)-like permease
MSASSALPNFVAFIAIIVWGATPAATQIAVTEIDSATVGMLRTVIAAVILLPSALLLRLPRPKDREGWIALCVSALAGFVLYTLLFTVGVKLTSTTHAALILTASPIFTGFIGFIVERKWPKWLWWLGAIIALVGEAILIGCRDSSAIRDAATLEGDLLVLASAVFSSAGFVAGGHLSSKIGTQATTAWGISLAGIVLLPVLLSSFNLSQVVITGSNSHSWLAVIYLAVFTSIIGYSAWYWALDKGGIARISPIQFTQPIVSLILAVSLLSETITIPTVIALVTIIFGVVLTRKAVAQMEQRGNDNGQTCHNI